MTSDDLKLTELMRKAHQEWTVLNHFISVNNPKMAFLRSLDLHHLIYQVQYRLNEIEYPPHGVPPSEIKT